MATPTAPEPNARRIRPVAVYGGVAGCATGMLLALLLLVLGLLGFFVEVETLTPLMLCSLVGVLLGCSLLGALIASRGRLTGLASEWDRQAGASPAGCGVAALLAQASLAGLIGAVLGGLLGLGAGGTYTSVVIQDMVEVGAGSGIIVLFLVLATLLLGVVGAVVGGALLGLGGAFFGSLRNIWRLRRKE